MKVLRNCRLVPEVTEGFDDVIGDIVIDGKYIKEICKVGTEYPEGTEIYDAAGKTVVPGFFDLHCHLNAVSQDFAGMQMRTYMQKAADSLHYAQAYLKQGYTTVRDCGNAHYISAGIKDIINRGLAEGARIITCGQIYSPTTKGNECFADQYVEVNDPRLALDCVRKDITAGAEFIKYMVTGAVLNIGGEPGAMVTTPEEIRAFTDAAASLGTYVAVHCHGTNGIKACIEQNVKTIEHATYLTQECVDMINAKGKQTAIIPTLSIMYSIVNRFFPGTPDEYVKKGKEAEAFAVGGIKLAHDGGIDIGWGTDVDCENFEKYPGLEFVARNAVDVPNAIQLRHATIDSARIIGLDDVLGTVKAGKYADLVVIDGNPDEDFEVMKNFPTRVYKEGRIVSEN